METLAMGSGITDIPDRAFSGCRSLTTLSIPATVTEIGAHAFSGCESLTSLTLSEGLTKIGSGSFELCTNLGSLTFPQSLTTIYGNAFRLCRGLTALTIPAQVTLIDQSAFKSCDGLTSVQFARGGLSTISSDTFSGCTSLAELEFNDRVVSIGTRAFLGCASLTAVMLGSQVGFVGDSAFSGCTGLAELTLNSGGTLRIDDRAFTGCSNLGAVTFPAGVTSIGDYAFSGCTKLTEVIFLGDAPQMGDEDQESGMIFIPAAPGFTVSYLSSSTGFTSPLWRLEFDDDEFDEDPTTVIDDAVNPAAGWLLGHGLPLETDLNQDLNGDGVTLLMAYALDLNPELNLRGSLPEPALDAGSLSLSFFGASDGIRYAVKTSTDLRSWTSEGVMLSEPDAEGRRSAMVSQDSPGRFLRLVVAERDAPP